MNYQHQRNNSNGSSFPPPYSTYPCYQCGNSELLSAHYQMERDEVLAQKNTMLVTLQNLQTQLNMVHELYNQEVKKNKRLETEIQFLTFFNRHTQQHNQQKKKNNNNNNNYIKKSTPPSTPTTCETLLPTTTKKTS